MEFKDFEKAMNLIAKFDKAVDTLESVNFSVFESVFAESFWGLQSVLFKEIYGVEGYEWIEYYLYEIPSLNESLAKRIEEGKATDDVNYDKNGNPIHAWEEDGTPIDLSSVKALWEYLESHYGNVEGKIEMTDNDDTEDEEEDDECNGGNPECCTECTTKNCGLRSAKYHENTNDPLPTKPTVENKTITETPKFTNPTSTLDKDIQNIIKKSVKDGNGSEESNNDGNGNYSYKFSGTVSEKDFETLWDKCSKDFNNAFKSFNAFNEMFKW